MYFYVYMIKNNILIVELKISNYSYYYLFYRKTQFLFDWWGNKCRKRCKLCMVHHYFNRHGETDCRIHFDNCSGQNKNKMVLWYGLWRVITGTFIIMLFPFLKPWILLFDFLGRRGVVKIIKLWHLTGSFVFEWNKHL